MKLGTPAYKVKEFLRSQPYQWIMGYEIEKLSIAWGEKPSVVMRRARELVHEDPTIEATQMFYEPVGRKVVAYRFNPSKDPSYIPPRPPEKEKPSSTTIPMFSLPEKVNTAKWTR